MLTIAVPLQLLAGVFGFLNRDPVLAIGMSTLSATWLTTSVLTLRSAPGGHSPVLGVAVLFLAAAVLLCAVVAAAGKPLVAIVLTFAGCRFALTGVVEYRQLPIARLCDGWLGLAVCVVALYAAAAFALQDVHQRTILLTLSRAGRS